MITTMHSDQNASPPRVEVITSVQRRRRWPTAEKIRLIEETMQPGMSVSDVARRAGVAPSLLFNWRRRMLEGGLQAVQLTVTFATKQSRAPLRNPPNSGCP
jgi:transposase